MFAECFNGTLWDPTVFSSCPLGFLDLKALLFFPVKMIMLTAHWALILLVHCVKCSICVTFLTFNINPKRKVLPALHILGHWRLETWSSLHTVTYIVIKMGLEPSTVWYQSLSIHRDVTFCPDDGCESDLLILWNLELATATSPH